MDKVYYISYSSPLQNGACYHKGEHPLNPSFLRNFTANVARKLSLNSGIPIPSEAVVIMNVIELPEDVAKTVIEQKLCFSNIL